MPSFETIEEFETALKEHKTPYVRLGDYFVFPMDVNVTGLMFSNVPFKVGDHYTSEYLAVMRW